MKIFNSNEGLVTLEGDADVNQPTVNPPAEDTWFPKVLHCGHHNNQNNAQLAIVMTNMGNSIQEIILDGNLRARFQECRSNFRTCIVIPLVMLNCISNFCW